MSFESNILTPSPVLAVDIGGTKSAVAILKDNNITILKKIPTPRNPADAIRFIIQTAREQGNITSVGIGGPGPLDAEKGIFLTPPNLPEWHGFPITSAIESELGIPVKLENDANLGALGEAIYGSGRGKKTVFYLTISTGIGTGLIIDGAIHSGYCGMAGEVWSFKPDNFFGHSNGPNIIDLCSGPGMLHRAQQYTGNNQLDMDTFLQEAMHDETISKQILEEGRNAISAMLVAVMVIVAPDVVVLGGGLCTDTRWFVEPVHQKVNSWLDIPQLAKIPVCRAKLWDEAVLYGAVILAKRIIAPSD